MSRKLISLVQPNFQQGPKEFNAHYLPYSAGVLWAYVNQFDSIKANYQLEDLIWRRDNIEDTAIKLSKCTIVGFSTYVWNKNYNYSQSMLKISDLFLFTSRTEYDPLVIYEAIINKKKIISLDTGNIKNILINNKNAFVSNNKKLIVSKIYEFLFSRYHYFNYKKFLWVNIMKKYYNIFLKT